MDKIIKLFKRIANYFLSLYSFEEREIKRIKRISRFILGKTKIFGFDFTFVDSTSFVWQYLEIFKKQVYKFKTENDHPYIIDCGANIGVSILYFFKLYPNSQIIAFEPDTTVFPILVKNMNNLSNKNITLVNKGLWNQEGKIEFISEGADGGHIISNRNTFSTSKKIINIETTRLCKYLDRNVDFLKIDIEGAETIVIEDCGNLLKNVQHIFIEYHSNVSELQRLDSILNVLTRNGFKYYLESSVLNTGSPFIKRNTINNLDNFLNIYAYK